MPLTVDGNGVLWALFRVEALVALRNVAPATIVIPSGAYPEFRGHAIGLVTIAATPA